MRLSDNIFFYLNNGKIVLWDYKNHNQFEVETRHFNALVNLSKGETIETPLAVEFQQAELVTTEAQNLNRQWHWDILSKIFHVGTKNIPISENLGATPEEWIEEYLQYCDEIGDEPEAKKILSSDISKVIELPKANHSKIGSTTLKESFYNRKTCRSFYDRPVSLEDLSTVLFYSFGYIHGSWEPEFKAAGLAPTAKRKASPSGGGLHPVEAYVVAFNVKDLPCDIYLYCPDNHSLNPIRDTETDISQELTDLLWGQYYSKGISFGVFLSGRMDLAAWKYKHSRAYRNVLLDVGHISQTFQLAATAEGMNTWITGAFNDSRIEEILDIDGYDESILFFVSAGYGDPVAFDDKMIEVAGKDQ